MLNIIAQSFVIVGVCVLTRAFILVRQLIEQLPSGSMRHKWSILKALIAFFMVGYLSYAIALWGRQMIWLDIVVPGIFFFGSGFVWLTVTLSLQTAADLRRVILLEHENITDPLIGIFNRRHLNRRLEEEVDRARRYKTPLSVLLLDIDHFKLVNDSYGHQVGDFVLNYLGKLLLQVIRPSDIAARYGGEEIMIIAPNTTISSANVLAERLRQHIETHELVVTNDSSQPIKIHITVSVGVACQCQENTDSLRLVKDADEALYRAKREGRNRTIISETICSSM
jgi:diguanylate cyclase (GGDEF)-like protein